MATAEDEATDEDKAEATAEVDAKDEAEAKDEADDEPSNPWRMLETHNDINWDQTQTILQIALNNSNKRGGRIENHEYFRFTTDMRMDLENEFGVQFGCLVGIKDQFYQSFMDGAYKFRMIDEDNNIEMTCSARCDAHGWCDDDRWCDFPNIVFKCSKPGC